jgi:glyoxylase-like metal-dependent hydrolase (beta-lactamase superfamily II)
MTAISKMSCPVELVADRLYVLGDTLPLDGRISWAPARLGRFQAVNCYLLREGDDVLLIDTGLRALWPTILGQLRELLAPKSRLKVFVTRPELDTVGNLPLLRELYTIEDTDVMAGGSDNPFDFFDAAAARGEGSGASATRVAASSHTVLRTSGFDLGPNRPVRVIVPKLRFLPTYWLVDIASKTLFTSDVFTHVDQQSAGSTRVIPPGDDPDARESEVADHLFSKFWWLPGASVEDFITDLRSIFDRLQPDIVAPGYGAVLTGRANIDAHLEALLAVLESCPQRTASIPYETR